MWHDFVLILTNDEVSEVQDCRQLRLAINHSWVLHFFLLDGDPNILVLLELKDLLGLAEWGGTHTLDHTQDEGVASTVPFKSVEFLFIHDLLELVQRLYLVTRDHRGDHEKKTFKVESDEEAILAIEL